MSEPKIKADNGGLRLNKGKLRLDLIPTEWITGLGTILTAALVKYPARNWERGMAHSIMVACLLRHLTAYLNGERYDKESGCHHLLHCAWNVLALFSYDVRGIGEDDIVASNYVVPFQVKGIADGA